MNLNLTYYFLLFIIYSCLGWILEVTCKLFEYKKFINRGFLIGPYCPIYGFGAIAITLFLYKYIDDPLILFLTTIITCVILEYTTSWIMEKLFKARWWDYSKRKFNIDGRVCLGTTIPFGLFGMFLIYVSNPFFINLLEKGNINTLNILAVTLFIVFAIDNIISAIVIFGFRKTAIQVESERTHDNTEQITSRVREVLSEKAWTYKRLIDAYPTFVTIKTKIQEITSEVKENAKEMRDNINEKALDIKNTINEKTDVVKNNINDKTAEVKNNIITTKKVLTDKFLYRKRKANVKIKLGKRRLKKKFTSKNNIEK